MTDVLILGAVELELRGLARELELPRVWRFPFPVYEQRRGSARLRLASAGLRAARLSDRWPALAAGLVTPLVISAGVCGALAPELKAGDMILPESVIGVAGERLNVTAGPHAAAVKLAPGARTGLLLTSPEVLGSPEAKAERFGATGAVAVDLESAIILAWALRQGCPSLVVRAVSDRAGQRLPAELVELVTGEGRLKAGRALAMALTHPGTIPHALLLQRGTRRALKSVSGLIAALVA